MLTVRAEQALALDCQPCLDILQSNTQTKRTERETTRQGRERQQGRGERNNKAGEREDLGCGRHFLNLYENSGDLVQAALFLTLLIRVLWTDSVLISHNLETILKMYNFDRLTLKRKKCGGFSYAFRHFQCL